MTQTLASIQVQLTQHHESPTSSTHRVSSSQPHSTAFSQPRPMKVDFPRFSGEDVMHWIYKAERFFKIYDILEEQKVDIASVHLDGKALPWFQMMEKANQVPNWFALSTAIQVQFGPSQFDNPREELLKLRQTSSVSEYYDSFNELATRAYGLDDALLLDCFVGGLHPELRREVKSHSLHSLLQAISLSKLFEEKFLPLHLPTRSRSYPPFPKPLTQVPPKPPTAAHTTPPTNTSLLNTPL